MIDKYQNKYKHQLIQLHVKLIYSEFRYRYWISLYLWHCRVHEKLCIELDQILFWPGSRWQDSYHNRFFPKWRVRGFWLKDLYRNLWAHSKRKPFERIISFFEDLSIETCGWKWGSTWFFGLNWPCIGYGLSSSGYDLFFGEQVYIEIDGPAKLFYFFD